MRRPPDLAYGLDDSPPARVMLSTALQQTTMVLIWVFPALLLARELRASPAEAAALLSMTFVVCGLGVMVQAMRAGGLGHGLLAPVSTRSAAFIVPSLLAAQAGGLPLVAGMTIVSGHRRPCCWRGCCASRDLIPPEIAGTVVLIIGLAIASPARGWLLRHAAAKRRHRGIPGGRADALRAGGLSVWGKGPLRWASMLFAMVVGQSAGARARRAGAGRRGFRDSIPLVGLPSLGDRLRFRCGAAAGLPGRGNRRHAEDPGWSRPAEAERRRLGAARPGAASRSGVTGDGSRRCSAARRHIGDEHEHHQRRGRGGDRHDQPRDRLWHRPTCLRAGLLPRRGGDVAQMPAPVIAAALFYAGGQMMATASSSRPRGCSTARSPEHRARRCHRAGGGGDARDWRLGAARLAGR